MEICKLQSVLQFLRYEMNDMLRTASFAAVSVLQLIGIIKDAGIVQGAKYQIVCTQ
jgi:hypothetical protein